MSFQIWRGGAIIYVCKDIIKISLLASFYYYRKQGLGRLLVEYINYFAHEFQKIKNKNFAILREEAEKEEQNLKKGDEKISSMDIIAVVSSNDQDALAFWKKIGFVHSDAKKFRGNLLTFFDLLTTLT